MRHLRLSVSSMACFARCGQACRRAAGVSSLLEVLAHRRPVAAGGGDARHALEARRDEGRRGKGRSD